MADQTVQSSATPEEQEPTAEKEVKEKTDPVDHDRLFKQLIGTFFKEFMELFFSEKAAKIDFGEVTPLDKEVFTDITPGDKHEVDLLKLVKYEGEETKVIVHIEAQSAVKDHRFGERMFNYFARLTVNHKEKVFPIVVFSFDKPERPELTSYTRRVMDEDINNFNFKVVQLNQLDWQAFLNKPNPIASAMMAKMKIAESDRARVKLECLHMLFGLGLDPARTSLISGFVGTYLRLNEKEEVAFQQGLEELGMNEKEELRLFMTDWELRGEARGEAKGRQEALVEVSLLLLPQKLGKLPDQIENRIRELEVPQLQQLTQQLLTFANLEQLELWLQQNQSLITK
jgi:hypothetical protein